jgi:hypothetical protein
VYSGIATEGVINARLHFSCLQALFTKPAWFMPQSFQRGSVFRFLFRMESAELKSLTKIYNASHG